MYNLSSTCQIPNLNKIYEKYFGDNIGIFVEVGAFDGESVSNTSCLADSGWTGYYIEPVKEHYEKCIERHKNNNNVKVSNFAIGTKEGLVPIYCSGIVSTLDEEQAKNVSSMELFGNPQYTVSQCIQIKLENYLKLEKIPKNFDLLVVDVEGREENVFESFNFNDWKPKMMIIELIDNHPFFVENKTLVESCRRVRKYIIDFGYFEVFRDEINTIFVLK